LFESAFAWPDFTPMSNWNRSMRHLLSLVAILVLSVCLANADDKKAVQPIKVVALERKKPVLYDKDVEPILVNKCIFCHSGNLKEGNLDLNTYEGLVKGGKRGSAIVAGNGEKSLLYRSAGRMEKPFMPPPRSDNETLTPEELALVKLWIDQGARAPAGVREKPKILVSAPPTTVHPIRAIVISPDKSALIASRGNEIHVFDAGSGKYIRSLVDPGLMTADKKPLKAAHLSLVESLAYSPDGKYIASGAFQEVVLWDAQTGQLRQRLGGFAERVVALAFSHDGKLLATGGGAPTEDGEIKIFDVQSAKELKDIKNGHSDTVLGVAFSPDDKVLATCGADKFVKTFEVSDGKFIKAFEGHTHHVLDVDWQANGKQLASAGADNLIKIWDYEKGEQVRTIAGHTKQVTRLKFIGKTPQFVTCSGDQTVRYWNADNGGTVRNFAGSNDYLYAVGVSNDGAIVASGGEEGVIHLYNGTNAQLVKTLVPPGVPEAPPKK
jgi:WD40 repeat protein